MTLYGWAVVVFALVVRRDRHRAARRDRARAAASSATCSAALFLALGVARLTLHRRQVLSVARKLRGFERVLDAPALFAVAYGEIASSIYFALGIIALKALGLRRSSCS